MSSGILFVWRPTNTTMTRSHQYGTEKKTMTIPVPWSSFQRLPPKSPNTHPHTNTTSTNDRPRDRYVMVDVLNRYHLSCRSALETVLVVSDTVSEQAPTLNTVFIGGVKNYMAYNYICG
jgi:hypothetical protein